MAPKPESSAKLDPLGREFRGVGIAGAYTRELFWRAFKDSLAKFDPRVQIHNPVMFVVWVGTLVTLALTIHPSLFGPSNASHLYNGVVTIVLALTVWFANYAEALAEGRGKAKAESLRQTRSHLVGVRVRDGGRRETVPASELRIGDIVRVDKNEVVPADGEVVEGVAYVNESAITGESAPVLKEPGTDMFSSVTAGTTVISDWFHFRVTVLVWTAPTASFVPE
jgi:K+-transporting ATPase ATPase B chain